MLRSIPKTAAAALFLVLAATVTGLVLLWPTGSADDRLPDSLRPPTYRAEVVAVALEECQIPQAQQCRRVEARLTEGPDLGDRASFPTGATPSDPDFEPGDAIRLASTGPEAAAQGLDAYAFADYERRGPMIWLVAAFVLVVAAFGRVRGVRALIGLAASIAVVTLFLVPSILDGRAPLLVALVAAMAVMFLTLGLAHGTGPKSVAAALGTTASLLITAGLAVLFVDLANITGFSSEEVSLLQGTTDRVSVQGLVLAGMVIGALGVLDDVTVSQASTVLALGRANPRYGIRGLYREAVEVGRDHAAATVNTLVLAYVGASLPVLLVFAIGDMPFSDAVNREAVSVQVVGMLVGSIGLISAVPLTTAVAAWLAMRMRELPAADRHAHVH